MKAYKAFSRDLKCRDFQFSEGEIFEVEGDPVLCENGFHFCKDLVLTLEYYPVDVITDNAYAEVEILGETAFEKPIGHKGCTNKIKILRIIPDSEVLDLVDRKSNSGDSNSGDSNSGNWNSGNWNSGYSNSGHKNSGHSNSGHKNSGNWNSGYSNSGYSNSGDRNSGNWNSGNWNSGNWNSGNWNSGNWNSGDRNSGYFNTDNPEYIRVFNKECLRSDWENSEKPNFLCFEVDDDIGYKASFQKSYEAAGEKDRRLLLSLPNFDAKLFYEISGIDVSEIKK